MESRNLKLRRSDMELNMPPRWGFSSFDAGAITMSLLRSWRMAVRPPSTAPP